jgi:dipeptidyl aminopeptidase/acylaminoacyl peptidase
MLLRILLAILGIVTTGGLLLVVLPLATEALITRAPAYVQDVDPARSLGLSFEEVTFATADGLRLRGWFIPADRPDAPAIIYAHGSGNDQRSGLYLVPLLHQAGYHILLFSFRNHGRSEHRGIGLTYGDGESQDVDAAVRFLREAKGIARIGVIGYSIGAASAILSAARNPSIGAVVAIAPYTCTPELWSGSRPKFIPPFVSTIALWLASRWKGFSDAETCPVKVVRQIAPRPLLLIHGTQDRYIPYSHSQRLFEAASAPKSLWLINGATHESIGREVLESRAQELLRFLEVLKRDA